jgi:precorrin-2 dehydrogenase/sirohydrochlorin ferrochelatase
MGLYPLFADLDGREVLVVGGGEVAARKTAALLKAGAQVRLHTQAVLHPALVTALADGRIVRLAGDFDPAWLDTVWLVVAATDDAAFNAGLAKEAGRRRRLCNVVDDAVLSTFQVPAVVDRAPLMVAISSGGAAPMLARRVREKLETLLDPSLGVLAGLFGRHRERIREQLPELPVRRRWFEWMLDGRMEQPLAIGAAHAEKVFLEELGRAAEFPSAAGTVTVVTGSASPDLYTLRALRALNEADAIVLADGLDDSMLEPARRDATRIRGADADAAVARALELAGGGARVVLMHDGRARPAINALLLRACEDAGIAWREVPAAG